MKTGLLEEHIGDLRRSGLADETIAQMAISSVRADDLDTQFKICGWRVRNIFEGQAANIYSWASKKRIPSQKVREALRFDNAAIEEWLEKQKRR